MSRFVEALKRLYGKGSIDNVKLQSLLTDGAITQEEYDYIIA